MPRPIAAGVLGIARTTAPPHTCSIEAMVMPAMIETTRLAFPTSGLSAFPASRNDCGLTATTSVSTGPASFGLRRMPLAARVKISGDGAGSITTTRPGISPCASQPVSIALPILPAPASAIVPVMFCRLLTSNSLVVPAKRSASRDPQPQAVLVEHRSRYKRLTLARDYAVWAPAFAGATLERVVRSLVRGDESSFPVGVEHRGRHGFGRRLAGPHHELERRKIALAGGERFRQHALTLRRGGGHAARQHKRLTVHDHASVGPEIEMADPELLVDRGDQPLHLVLAGGRNLHVEGAGQVQRLDLRHPGEGELIVGPFAFGDDGDLVLTGAFERPVVIGGNVLHHRKRVALGINDAFEHGHAVSTFIFLSLLIRTRQSDPWRPLALAPRGRRQSLGPT